MNFTWKILEVFAVDGLITGCRYHLTGIEEDISIETEGNFYFNEPSEKVPFLDVTEEMIANWIEKEAQTDGKCHITARLQEQLDAIDTKVIPPWKPQTFKAGI